MRRLGLTAPLLLDCRLVDEAATKLTACGFKREGAVV